MAKTPPRGRPPTKIVEPINATPERIAQVIMRKSDPKPWKPAPKKPSR